MQRLLFVQESECSTPSTVFEAVPCANARSAARGMYSECPHSSCSTSARSAYAEYFTWSAWSEHISNGIAIGTQN